MTKKYVQVQFLDSPFSSAYVFLTDIEDLQVNDLVAVDTRNGFKLATVDHYVEAPPENIASATLKWVIQKVDLTAHNERIERERQMAALKRKMDARRKELQEIEIFALLAKEDEGMKEMFDQYVELSK